MNPPNLSNSPNPLSPSNPPNPPNPSNLPSPSSPSHRLNPCPHPLNPRFKDSPKNMFPADLVTFTEEILNGKLRFMCGGKSEDLEYL